MKEFRCKWCGRAQIPEPKYREKRRVLLSYKERLQSIRELTDSAGVNLNLVALKRDKAIEEFDVAVKQKEQVRKEEEVIELQIKALNDKIIGKQNQLDKLNRNKSQIEKDYTAFASLSQLRIKLLTKQITKLTVKLVNLSKLAIKVDLLKQKERDSQKIIIDNTKKIEKIQTDLDKRQKKFEELKQEASAKKEMSDRQYQSLQKLQGKLDFYYKRMVAWYASHNLKLPVEYVDINKWQE